DRMVPPNIENAVAAQEIEIGGVIHVIQVRALRPRIDLVEADHALRCHQCAVNVSLVQLIILTQPRRDELLQANYQGGTLSDLRLKRNRNTPAMASNLDRLHRRPS